MTVIMLEIMRLLAQELACKELSCKGQVRAVMPEDTPYPPDFLARQLTFRGGFYHVETWCDWDRMDY